MSHEANRSRALSVGALARVEGEGGMLVHLREGRVDRVELRIYEPPRFFEALLRGRKFTEPPDITARICGICPVAYQMSACRAIEDACGVTIEGPLADLRRLIYCGEWIESHVLHIYLLHAPDFLGYEGAVEMAREHKAAVERGLQLKKVGNELISLLGGRAIHPVNVRVGGFFRAPTKRELMRLAERLEWAREAAVETVRWVAGFEFPDFEVDYTFLSLCHPEDYPIAEGRVVTSGGLEFGPAEYEEFVIEEHVPHSTALHAHLPDGANFLTGPLARYALNSEKLSPLARELAGEVGLGSVCRNPFRSIVVRAVEVVYACDEALRLIDAYEEPERSYVAVEPRAATGYGCTEAPRGVLYHRYRLDATGTITDAKIVPPTSQNQPRIEEDLKRFVEPRIDLPTEELTSRCEQAIRNYDPCISCATHFLRLEVVRG